MAAEVSSALWVYNSRIGLCWILRLTSGVCVCVTSSNDEGQE
jgi:hypothetical protein